MLPYSEFLCHPAYDVKKLFSIRGKLAVSSDLSSNLSDTQETGRLESMWKINRKFDLHKTQLRSKNIKLFDRKQSKILYILSLNSERLLGNWSGNVEIENSSGSFCISQNTQVT